MAKYRIEFTHTEESKYYAIVEADNQGEAVLIVEESAFDYVENDDPHDVQGLTIDVDTDTIEEIN